MKKILLIDGNGLIYRAYYATNYSNLRSLNGIPINAVLGFIKMFESILKQSYDYVLVALDKGVKNFRHYKLPSYKETRQKTPEDLIQQLPIVREFLDSYGVKWLEHSDFEADDIIATLVNKYSLEYKIDILSSDKDLEQLLSENVKILKPKKGLSDIEVFTIHSLKEKWDLTPSQIPDFKGLCGDPSDNLIGVKGIGEKTALKLLHQYYTLENIINHQDELNNTTASKIKEQVNYALLCKELATLRVDVPLKYNIEDLSVKTNVLILQQFYSKYNLRTLTDKISAQIPLSDNTSTKILNKWKKEYNCDENAIFVEMENENYHSSKIIGFGIVNKEGNFYLSYQIASKDKDFLDFLENKNYLKATYDLKKVINGCKWYKIFINGINFDLQLITYVLNSNMKASIDNAINYFNNENFLSDVSFYGKDKEKTIRSEKEIANFITSKAESIWKLRNIALPKLQKSKQYNLYKDIEFPCAFILAEMEFQGIRVDQKKLEELTISVLEKVTILHNKINDLAQQNVNPNSPKQLKILLFEKLKFPNIKKGSTAQEVLLEIQANYPHPLINALIEYRRYQKTYSTYLKGLQKYILKDQKIHTIYNQTNTTTGRLSSQEPNMQNISIHDDEQKLVRKVLIPNEKGQWILSSDYSQIELKILAHIANVKNLILAFSKKQDIHTLISSQLFKVKSYEVTDSQRRVAKAVNFGIVYGISEYGLKQQLQISIHEAKIFITRYFQIFPEIKNYMNNIINSARKKGYVETLFNRIRYIPTINDKNKNIREAAERMAINTTIQGTAADIIKIALINVYKALKTQNLKSYLVAQVHDELILEVFPNEIKSVQKLLEETMEKAFKFNVNLSVNMNIGNNWYEV